MSRIIKKLISFRFGHESPKVYSTASKGWGRKTLQILKSYYGNAVAVPHS